MRFLLLYNSIAPFKFLEQAFDEGAKVRISFCHLFLLGGLQLFIFNEFIGDVHGGERSRRDRAKICKLAERRVRRACLKSGRLSIHAAEIGLGGAAWRFASDVRPH